MATSWVAYYGRRCAGPWPGGGRTLHQGWSHGQKLTIQARWLQVGNWRVEHLRFARARLRRNSVAMSSSITFPTSLNLLINNYNLRFHSNHQEHNKTQHWKEYF